MSAELQDLDAQFDEMLLVIRQGVEKLDKEKGEAKMRKYVELENKLALLDDNLKSYRLEIYELDRGARAAYEKKAETYEAQVSRLRSELTFKRPATDREELFGTNAAPAKDYENMTATEMIDMGKDINRTDIDALKQANQLLEQDTITIAAGTLAKLKDQGDELEKIGIDLGKIESNLERSTKTLKTFARRVASDKVVWLFVLLIIGAIIFCIVWGTLHPGTLLTPNITARSLHESLQSYLPDLTQLGQAPQDW